MIWVKNWLVPKSPKVKKENVSGKILAVRRSLGEQNGKKNRTVT
jgi:hypothetical protein